MSTWTRYWLLQLPGWGIAALILWALWHWVGLPSWVTVGLFGAWVLKDLILYPLVRSAYEARGKTGAEELLGVRGVVQKTLSPRGYIRIRGELWQAEVEAGEGPLLPGTPVRVQGIQGLVLKVQKEEEPGKS